MRAQLEGSTNLSIVDHTNRVKKCIKITNPLPHENVWNFRPCISPIFQTNILLRMKYRIHTHTHDSKNRHRETYLGRCCFFFLRPSVIVESSQAISALEIDLTGVQYKHQNGGGPTGWFENRTRFKLYLSNRQRRFPILSPSPGDHICEAAPLRKNELSTKLQGHLPSIFYRVVAAANKKLPMRSLIIFDLFLARYVMICNMFVSLHKISVVCKR